MSAEKLYEENEKLTYATLKQFYPTFMYDEDALQEARCGLWKACCEFDETRGVRFSTYAVKVIRTTVATWLKAEGKYRELQAISLDNTLPTNSDEPNTTLLGELLHSHTHEEYEVVEIEASLESILTQKQLAIYKMLRSGASQKDIVGMSGLSTQGVSAYIKRIREKAKLCIAD